MTGAELAAVLTAAAGLVAAVTALVRAIQTARQLQAHVAGQASSVARAARCAQADHVIEE